MNVHAVNDVRHTGRHTAEPLVPEPSASDVELAIENPESQNDQVLFKSQQK